MAEVPGPSCGEHIRNCECRCGTYDPFLSNALIVSLLFFLGWKILEINRRSNLVNRCCFQSGRYIADEFECDWPSRPLQYAKQCPNGILDDPKGIFLNNLQKIEDCANEKDGESGKGSTFCKNCEVFLGERYRNHNGGVRMHDLIEGKNEEVDLGRENSDDMQLAKMENHYNCEDAYELDSAALKRAIKIEQGYRAAAFLELDKERKAAATAAHDAMVMILRLQNEKSLADLQVQQCRREAKQRQLYDQELIASLEENISMLELERQALEDELMRMYEKKFPGGTYFADVTGDNNRSSPPQFSPTSETNSSQDSGILQTAEANGAAEKNNDVNCKNILTDNVSTEAAGEDEALRLREGSKNSFKLSPIISDSVPLCVS